MDNSIENKDIIENLEDIFEKMSIIELKKYCKENIIKSISGLKKKKL